jgi:hypothetical protein
MYGAEFRKIDELTLVDWPEYENEKSLSEVAEKVIGKYRIREGDIVGGSSLGGMIAAEISKSVTLKKLFLIGSSLLPENMNPLLRKAGSSVDAAPVPALQKIAENAAMFSSGHTKNVLEMFSKADEHFMKAMCRAICEWEGCPAPQCRVCKIHGKKDRIIFPEKDSVIVEKAGHMIAVTHEIPVVKFIRNNLE